MQQRRSMGLAYRVLFVMELVGLEDTNQGSAQAQDAAKRTKPDDVVWKPSLRPLFSQIGSQPWSKSDTTANATPFLSSSREMSMPGKRSNFLLTSRKSA